MILSTEKTLDSLYECKNMLCESVFNQMFCSLYLQHKHWKNYNEQYTYAQEQTYWSAWNLTLKDDRLIPVTVNANGDYRHVLTFK
jgi:hypothetical protein